MKFYLQRAARIFALIVLLGLLSLFLRDVGHEFVAGREEAAPDSKVRFSKMARYVSQASEFVIVADMPSLFENAVLKNTLEGLMAGREGVVGDFADLLFSTGGLVDMVMVVGAIGDGSSPPSLAVVANGNFESGALHDAVSSAVESEGGKLRAETEGGRRILFEAGVEDPFAFVVLDSEHIAVGNKSAIASLIGEGGAKMSIDDFVTDAPLFGWMVLGKRLENALPKKFSELSDIYFFSEDGKTLTAIVKCADIDEAMRIQLYMAGARSLIRLRNKDDYALQDVLENISIDRNGVDIILSADLISLLNLGAVKMRSVLQE